MKSNLNHYRDRIENFLDSMLSELEAPALLKESMRYSTLSSGKRIRSLLVYAAGAAVDAELERLDRVAAAIECIHAYSLIHDDLPAMDDDNLRRGLPTNHIKFDEATAILAGDALQTLAFELLTAELAPFSDKQSRQLVRTLAQSAGANGMVGGQSLDMLATDCDLELHELENIHKKKTGALITASVVCGALCSEQTSQKTLSNLKNYADAIGLAFQVVDDVLDITSSTEELGKTSGADVALGKSTYPALIGLENSKNLATKLYQVSMDCLQAIGDNRELSKSNQLDKKHSKLGLLAEIAELVVQRTH